MNRDQYARQKLQDIRNRKAQRFSEKRKSLVFGKKITFRNNPVNKTYTKEQILQFKKGFKNQIRSTKRKHTITWVITIITTLALFYLLYICF